MDESIATIIMSFGRTHLLEKCIHSLMRHGLGRWPIYVVRTVPYINHEIELIQRLQKEYGEDHIRHEVHQHSRGTLHGWYDCLQGHPEIKRVVKMDDDCWLATDGFIERALPVLDKDPLCVSVGPVMPLSAQGAAMVIEALGRQETAAHINKVKSGRHGVRKDFMPWNFPGASPDHSFYIWKLCLEKEELIEKLREHYGDKFVHVDRWFQIGACIMERWWVDEAMARPGADEKVLNEDLGLTFGNRTNPHNPKYTALLDPTQVAIHFSYHQYHSEVLNLYWPKVHDVEY